MKFIWVNAALVKQMEGVRFYPFGTNSRLLTQRDRDLPFKQSDVGSIPTEPTIFASVAQWQSSSLIHCQRQISA